MSKDFFDHVRSAPKYKVVTDAELSRKHAESDLHLTFCKWVKKTYPELSFVRHEREKARSFANRNMMQVYNNMDGLPDFELIHHNGRHSRLYIEFKKPGLTWVKLDGFIKPEYEHQYKCHLKLWNQNSCAYFCNDLKMAQELLISYVNDRSYPMQVYSVSDDLDYRNHLDGIF